MFRRYLPSPKPAFYAPLFRGVTLSSSSSSSCFSLFAESTSFGCSTTTSMYQCLLALPLVAESHKYFCAASTPLLRCAKAKDIYSYLQDEALKSLKESTKVLLLEKEISFDALLGFNEAGLKEKLNLSMSW